MADAGAMDGWYSSYIAHWVDRWRGVWMAGTLASSLGGLLAWCVDGWYSS